MARESYTHEQWSEGNQRNYRVSRSLELAKGVFPNARFHSSSVESCVGILFEDDVNERVPSLHLDLGGNGILIGEPKYLRRAEKLAEALEKDERLGKFVLVQGTGFGSERKKIVYARGPANSTCSYG